MENGYRASALLGGIEAWRKAGLAMAAVEAPGTREGVEKIPVKH
jgi:hypothetical protein